MLDFNQSIQTKEFQTVNIEFSTEQDIKKTKIKRQWEFLYYILN